MITTKNPTSTLGVNGLSTYPKNALHNLCASSLVEEALLNKEGKLSSSGALMVNTGTYTGRSPKDRFIVKEPKTKDHIWWGNINLPLEESFFALLHRDMLEELSSSKIYSRDAFVGADRRYRKSLRVFTSLAWHNLFCLNMFLRPEVDELAHFSPEYTIICLPEFEADPRRHGTRGKNFTVINLEKKLVLIGGTAYAGEIKKAVFSIMNYILPLEEKQLSMHCSANMGDKGDTAIFFGLSGTGKTTLSADPKRVLIGDDEHGWSNNGIYNFEGGCYAKAINLDPEKEPQIWNAIKFGAIVENTIFHPGTSIINYKDNSLTENTRTAYPISHIPNSIDPPLGTLPQTVFFLTADAFGVLPPISKLNPSQAMYHFISGYTAKVAGTEMGIKEPQVTFSACFGEAFLPLNPTVYAALLGKLMKQHQVDVWLINTGWTGGSYGTGKRIPLAYTRAMVNAALEGKMNNVSFEKHPIFKIQIPSYCPGVPSELLNPKNTWENPGNYDQTAAQLARAFQENFAKYTEEAPPEIMDGGPSLDF